MIDIADEPDRYYEEPIGTSFRNTQSAQQVLRLVEIYQRRGIPRDKITVITPYLPQVEYVQAKLKEQYGSDIPVVTTIDAYQGGENEAVIFDFLRSNPQKRIGFIKDLRRLNVGLSRARENLALIWDSRTMIEEPSHQSAEDMNARRLFRAMEDYFETEVRTFFPEMGEINLSQRPLNHQPIRSAA